MKIKSLIKGLAGGLCMALLCTAMPAFGQKPAAAGNADGFSLEINKAETHGQNCRIFLLARNGQAHATTEFKLDLVSIGPDEIIQSRMLLDLGRLPAGKTRLKVFELAGLSCQSVSRLLLNDVTSCQFAGGHNADCLSLVSTSSRHSIGLVQ